MSCTNDYITFFMSAFLTYLISCLLGPELVTEITLHTDIEAQ